MSKASTNVAADLDFEMSIRRLAVCADKSGEADGHDLYVDCPLVRHRVTLERCGKCVHSRGLLLDPDDGGLTLRCAYDPLLAVDGVSR